MSLNLHMNGIVVNGNSSTVPLSHCFFFVPCNYTRPQRKSVNRYLCVGTCVYVRVLFKIIDSIDCVIHLSFLKTKKKIFFPRGFLLTLRIAFFLTLVFTFSLFLLLIRYFLFSSSITLAFLFLLEIKVLFLRYGLAQY